MKNLQNKSKYFKINQNFHFSKIPCILDGEKMYTKYYENLGKSVKREEGERGGGAKRAKSFFWEISTVIDPNALSFNCDSFTHISTNFGTEVLWICVYALELSLFKTHSYFETRVHL